MADGRCGFVTLRIFSRFSQSFSQSISGAVPEGGRNRTSLSPHPPASSCQSYHTHAIANCTARARGSKVGISVVSIHTCMHTYRPSSTYVVLRTSFPGKKGAVHAHSHLGTYPGTLHLRRKAFVRDIWRGGTGIMGLSRWRTCRTCGPHTNPKSSAAKFWKNIRWMVGSSSRYVPKGPASSVCHRLGLSKTYRPLGYTALTSQLPASLVGFAVILKIRRGTNHSSGLVRPPGCFAADAVQPSLCASQYMSTYRIHVLHCSASTNRRAVG